MNPARAFAFSATAIATYTVAEYFNVPMLRYHVPGGLLLGNSMTAGGHLILWYGWIAAALAAGLLAATVVPKKLLARVSPDIVWITFLTAMIAVLAYEKRWFF